jgi:alkylation response protein AidB-like acyl-CoA dehydrogenase
VDFNFTEDEQSVAQLARQILSDHTTNDALKAHERGGEPFDAALWKALAQADLLGIAIPEADGGSGLGFVTLGLVLEEVGRAVAPVPAYASLVLGALPIARLGDATTRAWLPEIARGERIVTGALSELESSDPYAPATRVALGAVHGTKTTVPFAEQSSHIVVTTRDGLVVVDARGEGVTMFAQHTSDGLPHALVELDGAPVVATLGDADAVAWLIDHAIAATCLVQLGVAEQAIVMTGAYSRERVQFDRPIGSFQAVHQRAADAFIWVEGMRLTAWEAAWRLAQGLDAREHVAVAKYVAAEGGQFTAYACQHLHGGIGIDVDYPLHRYFKWATQLEHELGSARHHLDRLGTILAST